MSGARSVSRSGEWGSRGGDDKAFVPLPEIFGPLSVLYGHILGGAYEYTCSVSDGDHVRKKYSGTTVRSRLTLAGASTFCTVFSGDRGGCLDQRCLPGDMSAWIEKIPIRFGKIATWLLLVFFCGYGGFRTGVDPEQ